MAEAKRVWRIVETEGIMIPMTVVDGMIVPMRLWWDIYAFVWDNDALVMSLGRIA
jgi:hypothetical protein